MGYLYVDISIRLISELSIQASNIYDTVCLRMDFDACLL